MPAASALRLPLAAALLTIAATVAQAQVSYTSMPLDKGFGELDPSQPSVPPAQIIANFEEKE